MSSTDFDQLHDNGKRRLLKFDPTISSGTILTLITMLTALGGAWATYQSDKATTRLELDQVKAAAAGTAILPAVDGASGTLIAYGANWHLF